MKVKSLEDLQRVTCNRQRFNNYAMVVFIVCAILGLALLAGGLLVPAYFPVMDASVIARAGRNSPGLLEQGQTLADKQRLGAAELLMQAARIAQISGWTDLDATINKMTQKDPVAMFPLDKDLTAQHTGQTLAQLRDYVFKLPLRLQ